MGMRVDNIYSVHKLYNTNVPGRQRRANAVNDQNQDTFTLSVHAEDYHLARRAVSRVPDVRGDKVDAVQSQIASGHYSVSAAMVAEKILQNLEFAL